MSELSGDNLSDFEGVVSLCSFSAITRRAKKDMEINGVKIPAGMIIQVNAEAMHMNPKYWGPEDVNKFVPER